MTLGTESNRSASVRVADLDLNGTLDVIVANGRHWPTSNFCFLNQGRARMNVQRTLGLDRSTSYAAEPADLDGDGDLDIAVGNDMAPNQIFINDGHGSFSAGRTFGSIASVRSLTAVDIDLDGDIDLLTTCRGMPNQIYFNHGDATFSDGVPFGSKNDSTIDVAAADWNGDGQLDLVLANRDNQQNAILLNKGDASFNTAKPFGKTGEATRAVAVADLNSDSYPDIVAANIGQPNRVYFGNGSGEIVKSVSFGHPDGRSYSIAIADLNRDGHVDLVVGNVGQQNSVFINRGDGQTFSEVQFGDPGHATYGVSTGDLDGDGYDDIATANSDAQNRIYLNRPALPKAINESSQTTDNRERNPSTQTNPRTEPAASSVDLTLRPNKISQETTTDKERASSDWSAFRGDGSRGVADGFAIRESWRIDGTQKGDSGIAWRVKVPGLGHSSPVIVGDRIFLATAVSSSGDAPLMVGRGGQPTAADDQGEQAWIVICYNRRNGSEIWRRVAHKGVPRATRHEKATHANTSVAIEGDNVVAFFGSEGIYCYDLDGNLKWSQDLGVINISKYGIGWGFASSPAVFRDQIAVVCDDPDNPFVATLRLSDGTEVWRRSRQGISERNWSTPLIHQSEKRTQVVVNGWPWIVSYDLTSGDELWKIRGGGDNPVPTPFEANGWLYLTSAHGTESPIFVVRPDATGDITPPEDNGSNQSVVWSTRRGGSYMSTPVVYNDYLYLGNTNGVIRCFNASTGEKIYEKRLGTGASVIASLVAADGKIYCPSENGIVYVLKAGADFKILAKNEMGEPCFASPAIAEGVLYIRTTGHLTAIK